MTKNIFQTSTKIRHDTKAKVVAKDQLVRKQGLKAHNLDKDSKINIQKFWLTIRIELTQTLRNSDLKKSYIQLLT